MVVRQNLMLTNLAIFAVNARFFEPISPGVAQPAVRSSTKVLSGALHVEPLAAPPPFQRDSNWGAGWTLALVGSVLALPMRYHAAPFATCRKVVRRDARPSLSTPVDCTTTPVLIPRVSGRRRQVISGGLFAASACFFAPPKGALAAEVLEDLPGVDTAKAVRSGAEKRAALARDVAAAEAKSGGGRLSDEERRRRADAAAKAAENPRPAPQVSPTAGTAAAPTAAPSDEFAVDFEPSEPLGLTLKDLRVGFTTRVDGISEKGTSRVLVADVVPGGQAAANKRIAIDMIVVAVNGENVEKESAKSVQDRLAKAKAEGRGVQVTFKDPFVFNESLDSLARNQKAMDPIATKIAPGGSKEAEQVLGVRRLEVPESCKRNSQNGDLIEIRYALRLEDGTLVDGMDLASRLGDDSIQFVLGRQPAGQFPPSWDIGLVGMCVGERRELDVPPVLGYGPKGLPKRGIPPNARLLYDIELLAINGLATP